MKTFVFFIVVFINVIINDVIVFGYIYFLNQESVRLRNFFFHVWKMCTVFPFDFLWFLSIFQLYKEEEPFSAPQDNNSILIIHITKPFQ